MRFSTILALSFLAACGDSDSGQVVKVAWVLPAGHPSSKALEFFEQRAEVPMG